MKIRRRREFACGVLFTAVGLAFAWAAGTWPLGRASAPGPGVLGLCLALAFTMLGGFVLFMATSLESPGGDPFVPLPSRPALLVLLALLSFGVLLPRLGLVGTVAAGTALTRLAWPWEVMPGDFVDGPVRRNSMRWRRVLLAFVVLPATMAALAWLVCHAGLKLHLPLWPLPLAAWLAG